MENKLKPFDLEAALNGAEVVTRSGKQVSELVYLKTIRNPNYKVIASIGGGLETYSEQGTYHSDVSSELDLFMKPQQLTKWVNIYEDSSGYFIGKLMSSTKEAATGRIRELDKYVDTIQITFEL